MYTTGIETIVENLSQQLESSTPTEPNTKPEDPAAVKLAALRKQVLVQMTSQLHKVEEAGGMKNICFFQVCVCVCVDHQISDWNAEYCITCVCGYCIAGNSRKEKIFANFATCSCWQNFLSVNFCPVLTITWGIWQPFLHWRKFIPLNISAIQR